MESIFENTTTLTRQNLTEMARATVCLLYTSDAADE